MTESLLLCIGIDEYRDRNINKLSYCAADCFRTERIFKIFNIASTFISLINQDASREKIIKSLQSFPEYLENLYVYYSSHGENIEKNSYLYTYDTSHKLIEATSLPLSSFIDILSGINAKKIILVLDACKIIIPRHQKNNLKILYPNSELTHEDTVLTQSIFTKKILSSFSQDFYYKITNKKIQRYKRVRQDISKFLENENIIFINGKSGLGKSYLLRQLKNEEKHTFYVSLPKLNDLTINIILSLINEEISFTSENEREKFVDADPERYIRFYTEIHPYSLLIIDHVDHLNQRVLNDLLNFLNELPIQKIISSRHSNKLIPKKLIYNFPILTKEDIVDSIKEMNLSEEFISQDQIYLCETYIKLLEYIYEYKHRLPSIHNVKNTNAINKITQALAISGGFILQSLFTAIFNLEKEAIEQLKQTGLIIFHDGFYYPHDCIFDENIDHDLNELHKISCEYWKCEIKRNPTSSKAIQQFILLANTFSLNFMPDETETYKTMISAMQGRHNTYFLLLLFGHLRDKDINLSLRLFLCESLIDVGKFDEAKDVILNYPSSNLKLSVLTAELHWWRGEFVECINISTNLLSKKLGIEIKTHFFCSRGIGYFFLGKWEQSSQDLKKVISRKNISNSKLMYLSYCVLATIEGLRGTNFHASVDNFMCALKYAKISGKLSWLALIYGNIGEILWKAGYWNKSIEILNISSHFAYLTDNEPLYLEINRNLLHVYHRSCKKSEEKKQLKKLERIFSEHSNNYVKMQIVNTLNTHYIFAGNKKYIKYMVMAEQLTKGNAEYQIYTLSNFAIAELLEKNVNSAIINMRKALELCLLGKNWLAIKQCLDDWDDIITSHHLVTNWSKRVFQKWHQILEIELLPYLHHLSRLCEYLELP